jgi:hypothetical protein
VDPELQTVVWENGADLAPEFLYENTRVLAQPGRVSGRVPRDSIHNSLGR